MRIWRRATGEVKPGSVDDLAVKNLYAVLNTNGEFDGRMEALLGTIEAEASQVVNLLLASAFRRPGPLTDDSGPAPPRDRPARGGRP